MIKQVIGGHRQHHMLSMVIAILILCDGYNLNYRQQDNILVRINAQLSHQGMLFLLGTYQFPPSRFHTMSQRFILNFHLGHARLRGIVSTSSQNVCSIESKPK